jgi:L-lactate dehydrogenase complex protein LldG
MSTSREHILGKLRAAQKPFVDVAPIANRQPMVPLDDLTPEGLLARFKEEASKIGCYVYHLPEADTIARILELIGDNRQILAWDFRHIALPGLSEALAAKGISVAAPADGGVKVGITGADAALAATGSLVVSSGRGKHRTTSLLPDIHLAVVRVSQVCADLEEWISEQRTIGQPAFALSSNTVIISGPSKTADIAQELIKGAHGPRVVHIFIVG